MTLESKNHYRRTFYLSAAIISIVSEIKNRSKNFLERFYVLLLFYYYSSCHIRMKAAEIMECAGVIEYAAECLTGNYVA
jgi:hypothetical protein